MIIPDLGFRGAYFKKNLTYNMRLRRYAEAFQLIKSIDD